MDDAAMEHGGSLFTHQLVCEALAEKHRENEERGKKIDSLLKHIEELQTQVCSLNEKLAIKNSPPTHPEPEPPVAPKPKRHKKVHKPTTTMATPISTSNSFSLLTPTDLDAPALVEADEDSDFPSLPPAPKPKKPFAFPNNVPTVSFTPPSATPKPTDKIPPIILHNKALWMQVSSDLHSKKLTYSRATNTREGIRITPSTIQDYRSIHAYLDQGTHSFHSFQLPSEKTIKVVIRGVPQDLSEDQILVDLTNQNFTPLLVKRLKGRDNRPAPLVMVQVEKIFSSIYTLKTLCGLDVTVEAKRIPSRPLQCHRCQRFGHTQPNCHAPYSCMKCAESHSTHLCPKPTTTPATCSNCNQSHISTHNSCSQNPLNLKKSYSTALKPSPTPKQNSPKPMDTHNPNIKSFAQMAFPLFEALLATNPTPEALLSFTTQLSQLKQTIYG